MIQPHHFRGGEVDLVHLRFVKTAAMLNEKNIGKLQFGKFLQ